MAHVDKGVIAKEFSHEAFDDLEEVFKTAIVAVAPLRRNAYNDLAMPVKIFDYMSFGRPLVVTDCPSMASLVEETGAGLVVEDNVQALAEGILQLLGDRNLATRSGLNAYQAVQTNHSWPKRAAAILEMIQAIEHSPARREQGYGKP